MNILLRGFLELAVSSPVRKCIAVTIEIIKQIRCNGLVRFIVATNEVSH